MNEISSFKDIHRGKRLFILASGPSMASLDLTPLRRRIVMGLNRSFLAYPDTHYHCAMDGRLFDEYEDLLRKTRYLFTLEDRPFGIPLRLLGSEGFSLDAEEGVYSGYTISYLALQIAVYMGFQQIFYVGLDLKNRAGNTHFFGQDWRSLNHDKTEFPRMKRMLTQASEVLAGRDIEIFNCSAESALECFPKVSFEWAIEQ